MKPKERKKNPPKQSKCSSRISKSRELPRFLVVHDFSIFAENPTVVDLNTEIKKAALQWGYVTVPALREVTTVLLFVGSRTRSD